MAKKVITVEELRRQLQVMEAQGFGDSPVVYMDLDSRVYDFDEGVHDTWQPRNLNEVPVVVLG